MTTMTLVVTSSSSVLRCSGMGWYLRTGAVAPLFSKTGYKKNTSSPSFLGRPFACLALQYNTTNQRLETDR